MNIRDVDNVCIVDISGNDLSQADITKLRKLYKEKSVSTRIGIDFAQIKSVEPEFFALVKEAAGQKKLSVFNADSSVYLQLFVSQADRYLNLYLNERDFLEDKRSIVKRRLKVLKTA